MVIDLITSFFYNFIKIKLIKGSKTPFTPWTHILLGHALTY